MSDRSLKEKLGAGDKSFATTPARSAKPAPVKPAGK